MIRDNECKAFVTSLWGNCEIFIGSFTATITYTQIQNKTCICNL